MIKPNNDEPGLVTKILIVVSTSLLIVVTLAQFYSQGVRHLRFKGLQEETFYYVIIPDHPQGYGVRAYSKEEALIKAMHMAGAEALTEREYGEKYNIGVLR